MLNGDRRLFVNFLEDRVLVFGAEGEQGGLGGCISEDVAKLEPLLSKVKVIKIVQEAEEIVDDGNFGGALDKGVS